MFFPAACQKLFCLFFWAHALYTTAAHQHPFPVRSSRSARNRKTRRPAWPLSLPAALHVRRRGGLLVHGRRDGAGVSYEEKGRTWHTLSSAEGFVEEGTASWYGDDFDGKPTASGEIYDQDAATCAHKILPLQTRIRVTNLRNGRSVVLRVNDRGPFVAHRVVDLSRTGARRLGIENSGITRVRIQALP